MKIATNFEYRCDGCREVEHCAELPENWKRIKRKDYCPECAKIRDRKNFEKYPAHAAVHTPSGILYACLPHANMAAKVYGVLGAHINAEMIDENIACINCMNEKEDSNNG